MDTAELQFNIIYTPGSVAALSPFVASLLEWSDCRYQLVANGCDGAERQQLEAICEADDRLSYRCISTDGMIEHSDALELLQADCTDEWFCAMDSDIFATGDFTTDLSQCGDTADVVTGCLPVWAIASDQILKTSYRRLQGTHVELENGTVIGCTYLLMYKNSLIDKVRETDGIGFARYYFADLPTDKQDRIRSLGAEKTDYDTAIVLNLMLTSSGHRVAYCETPNLIHLGGLSGVPKGNLQFSRGSLDKLSIQLKRTVLSGPVMWLADLYYGTANIDEKLTLAEYQNLASRARRRAGTSRYFGAVLNALLKHQPPPAVPHLANTRVEQKLDETARLLGKYFAGAPGSATKGS